MATSMKKAISNSKLFKRQAARKIPKKLQPYFLKTLAELLEGGFSIQQGLEFMALLLPKYKHLLRQIEEVLGQGEGLEKALHPLGFSLEVIGQLFYAQKQGRFVDSLYEAAEYLDRIQNYKKELIKTLIYPILLVFFMLAMLFGMRAFLLPHVVSFISQESYDSQLAVRLLIDFFTYFPHITLLIITIGLLTYLYIDYRYRRLSVLDRMKFLVKWPFLRRWIRWYCSYQWVQELAYFYKGGYSLQQIIEVLTVFPINPFLSEVAAELKVGLLAGEALVDLLEPLEIFTSELPLIIYRGELISQVGTQCQLYASKILDDLMEDISRKISWIQPVLFLAIGLLVIAMYLLMMLPMLTMEGL